VYIAWTPGSAGESALWIMAADGSDRHALTEPGGSNISPDLSGDGSRIVWIHEFEVVAMDDQGRITQLTNCPAVPHPTYGMQRSFGSPKWSPDGTRIAVCEDGKLPQVTNGPHCQILVMRADGREQRYIAQGEERAYFDGGPSWLPDGKRVLVRSSPPANDPTGFFTFNLDNGSLERVYTGEGQSPEWGETILYRENRQILTTTPGGTPQVVLSETDLPPQAHFGSATWSHDHTRVIFSVHMGEFRVVSPDQQIYLPEDQQPDWELWSVAPDGTDLKNLSNDPALRQDSPGT